MNILILNASPRKKGNIARLLDIVREEAEQKGANVTMLRVDDLHVHPCTGCMACRTRRECVLPADDSLTVLQKIKECDALVIGAPCYWGNMPGTLKILFDRLVYGLMGESPRGIPVPLLREKRAMIISTCTTPFPFNIWFHQSRGTIRAVREILKWSGFRIVSTYERGGTRMQPLTEKDLERCRKRARKLF